MTFDELYEYGMNSKPAKICIPQELVQSLPRLERINGKIVVQYWYYYRNVSYPWQIDEPLYYAAFDIYENRLVEMKKISRHSIPGKSWLDLLFWSREMREVKYLEHCVTLLERGSITEEEIIDTQAMWLDCQAKDIFPELYYRSGIRPEAVQKLISPEMAETSRYLLKIWSTELLKCLHQKLDGHEQLEAVWNDPVFMKEREIFYELRDRGPLPGMRFEGDY
ncbi:MAG: hypothetical protein IKA47_00285 [Oscillospiraceae bacterium]|nr:hypothetical protein [Oscillospiraceae bacterium]